MRTVTTERDRIFAEFMAKQQEERLQEAIEKVMKMKQGRLFFMWILDKTGYQANAFTGNSQTFYNEGRRSIGIEIAEYLVSTMGRKGAVMKQKAELEYIDSQLKDKELFKQRSDEE